MIKGGSIENLIDLWTLRDDIDELEGYRAYMGYNQVMRDFANFYDAPFDRVVEVFVALSPNNDYHGNLRSMASVLNAHQRGRVFATVTVSTYRACSKRAWGYITGQTNFLDTVKGPKIRAFRDNIINHATSQAVTVDGHMIGAWMGESLTMKAAAVLLKSKRDYRLIESKIQKLAGLLKLKPHQLQAVLWMTRKRVLNVKYDAQYGLFNQGDAWTTLCDPEDYPPY